MLFFILTSEGEISGETGTGQLDEGLILKISTGDKAALAELYAQTKTAVYGFALSILRNPGDAEDVMQDAYVRIYSAAAEYRAQGKPMAWILTITRNLCFMRLRAAAKTADSPEIIRDTPQDISDSTEDIVSRIVLETAMETLSDEERQIVMLHAVAGQRHREIASLMEIPLSTVLSKYSRALSKLRKQLKGDEPNE